jgi:hypothetical protein
VVLEKAHALLNHKSENYRKIEERTRVPRLVREADEDRAMATAG